LVTRTHVWGASGYAAAELVRLLHSHPELEVGVLESRSHAGELLADHFPALRSTAHRFEGVGGVLASAAPGDVVFTAGNDDEARSVVPELLARGVRVIDLSASYRFDKAAVYGLTEWNRDAICGAQLVANPGCYPTATLLALLPLATAGIPRHVVIDAKSGITGAGRTPAFTPHVVPLARGMLVDTYAIFDAPVDAGAVEVAYTRAYRDASFIRILGNDRAPSVAAVVGTNDAELRVDVDGAAVRTICAIDNLGKGAAGQAIANCNLMCGYPEETGLSARAIFA
jgi:N-acetyl-gamma-glutamyl-phosphate reductase